MAWSATFSQPASALLAETDFSVSSTDVKLSKVMTLGTMNVAVYLSQKSQNKTLFLSVPIWSM
jgi:hypothetical protein